MLWKRRDKIGITWVAWNHLATPKPLVGLTTFDLSIDMMGFIAKGITRVLLIAMLGLQREFVFAVNRLVPLGVKEMGDVVDAQSLRLMDFVEVQIIFESYPIMELFGRNYIRV